MVSKGSKSKSPSTKYYEFYESLFDAFFVTPYGMARVHRFLRRALVRNFQHSEDRRKFIDGFTDFEHGHLPAVSWNQMLPA